MSSENIAPTSFQVLDSYLDLLNQKKKEWVETSIAKRVSLLKDAQKKLTEHVEEWISASNKARHIEPGSNLEGEEWIAGPGAVARYLRMAIEALQKNGVPKPKKVWNRDNQAIARVFPENLYDKLFLAGVTADVWMQPGKPASQAKVYQQKEHSGKVALVLGAGNQSSIPVLDALYKLLAEDEVVILKMNPVNEYLGPIFEKVLSAFIQTGFVSIVYGGSEVGEYLCQHPRVDSVHITGSSFSHDAIVWGATSEERQRRKEADSPKLTKPITSELGCVTPIIVVPGAWNEDDLKFQAQNILSMVTNNNSYNCNAAKVIVTSRDWPQREAFIGKIKELLQEYPSRFAYYPGSFDRHSEFLKRYPNAKQFPTKSSDHVPWTFIPNIPQVKGEYALSVEAFCGVFGEVALPAYDVSEFLRTAVEFCNEKCFGTLSCGIIIHPETEKKYEKELDNAVANLRYGGIGINTWPAIIYWLMSTTWGAFPGHSLKDIQSGRGVVHNTYLFDYPQKSVVRSPFRVFPKPPYFVTHKNLKQTAKRVVFFETRRSLAKLLSVAAAAMKG